MLLYKVGRFLQVAGMIILPIGVAGNIADPARVDVKTSLIIASAGILIFCIGWLLQQAGRPK
jgi:hypothetical protein